MKIDAKLKLLLKLKDWTIHKAAQVAESRGLAISRATIYNVAAGKRSPLWPTIMVICELLEIEPSEFLSN